MPPNLGGFFMVRSYYPSECHADYFDFERIEALKPAIRSEERFSRNAETDLVCRLLLEKKITQKGLRCPSIPDLFHMGHDLAKGYSLCIFGRLRQAKRDLEHAKQRLEQLQKSTQADPAPGAQAQVRVAACATSVHHRQAVGSAWPQPRS